MIGYCIIDFGCIGLECLGFAVEVQLTLNKKCSELSSIRAIKDIQLLDFGSVTGALIFSYHLSELINSVGKVGFIGI